jgi:ubiquinone/menaquinone biosynthesis C-methylase UbiE
MVWCALVATGCSRTPAQPSSEGPASSAFEPRATATATSEPAAIVPSAAPSADEAPPTPPKDGIYLGRRLATPMSYQGASWLERASRDETERPEHVLDVLGIRPGMHVADFGAGSGYFTVRIARRVGAAGRVYAVDMQREMLTLLEKKKQREALPIELVLAEPARPSLPDASVDLVLMVDVYHELERPDLTLAQIRRALRPEGRLALVEYRAEDEALAIKPEHKMSLRQIRLEMNAAHYRVLSVDESLPSQRIVVMGR